MELNQADVLTPTQGGAVIVTILKGVGPVPSLRQE
jgi:hypothetical protein